MMSRWRYYSLALLLLEATAGKKIRSLQEIDVEDVGISVCQGDELAQVSRGCNSAEECRIAAERLGLTIGNPSFGFEGDWDPRGCYYYPSDHPTYPNQAFFGTQGTCFQIGASPGDGAMRIECALVDDDTSSPTTEATDATGASEVTEAPDAPDATEATDVQAEEVSFCDDPSICVGADDCRAAALDMGLQLGGPYDFFGPWAIKGCHYYPLNHPTYGGQAYFGFGAATCDELSVEPWDGSVRLGCSGEEELELMGPLPPTVAPTGTTNNNAIIPTVVPTAVTSATNLTQPAPIRITKTPTMTPAAVPITAAPNNATDISTDMIKTPTPTNAPTDATPIADDTIKTTAPTTAPTNASGAPTITPVFVSPVTNTTPAEGTASDTTSLADEEEGIVAPADPPSLAPDTSDVGAPGDNKDDKEEDDKDDKQDEDGPGGPGDPGAEFATNNTVFGDGDTEVSRSQAAISAFENGEVVVSSGIVHACHLATTTMAIFTMLFL